MSILSQIGVVILIVFIILILIRSNKNLEEVAKEGEHFVDEWDLRQQRKAERLIEKEEKKHQKKLFLKKNTEAGNDHDFAEENEAEEEISYMESLESEDEAEDKKELFFEEDHKIISMDAYKNPGITLVELDENNQVIRRVRVDKLPFTIGRSTENQLVLDDLCVARKHCRIVERGGQFILEDVGTANKLFVNGKMEEWVVLGDQLKIYIGNVEFRVEMGAERSHRTQLYQNAGEYYYE